MSGVTIRPARPDELSAVAELERAAGRLFDEWKDRLSLDDGEPTKIEDLAQAQGRGDLFVAVDPDAVDDAPIGFCMLTELDGQGHLYELDVHPDHGRRGIGRRLVEFVIETMKARGHAAVTLTTFRDVPWNRPFYESAGFVVVEPGGPEMLRTIAHEESWGLDFSQRCVMRREL